MPKNKATYHLKIPSQTDNLEVIREFISNLARKAGFQNDDVDKIELAVDEACSNVIKHAYKKTDKKPIIISVEIEKNKFTVSVTDHGKGFDINKIKTPDMKEYLAQMRVGGLGIYLIKSLMDEVDFTIEPGVKNQVKLVKYV
ncbi:ATP-binding protein [candidate division KSB1 bacterium]|nr:ATP-binding protein [candidate division KSB1 bacterium]